MLLQRRTKPPPPHPFIVIKSSLNRQTMKKIYVPSRAELEAWKKAQADTCHKPFSKFHPLNVPSGLVQDTCLQPDHCLLTYRHTLPWLKPPSVFWLPVGKAQTPACGLTLLPQAELLPPRFPNHTRAQPREVHPIPWKTHAHHRPWPWQSRALS